MAVSIDPGTARPSELQTWTQSTLMEFEQLMRPAEPSQEPQNEREMLATAKQAVERVGIYMHKLAKDLPEITEALADAAPS